MRNVLSTSMSTDPEYLAKVIAESNAKEETSAAKNARRDQKLKQMSEEEKKD